MLPSFAIIDHRHRHRHVHHHRHHHHLFALPILPPIFHCPRRQAGEVKKDSPLASFCSSRSGSWKLFSPFFMLSGQLVMCSASLTRESVGCSRRPHILFSVSQLLSLFFSHGSLSSRVLVLDTCRGWHGESVG